MGTTITKLTVNILSGLGVPLDGIKCETHRYIGGHFYRLASRNIILNAAVCSGLTRDILTVKTVCAIACSLSSA